MAGSFLPVSISNETERDVPIVLRMTDGGAGFRPIPRSAVLMHSIAPAEESASVKSKSKTREVNVTR